MADTFSKTVVAAAIGPAELAAGCTYVHDIELDGDEDLAVGDRIEIRDDAGRLFAATVTDRLGARWQLTIRPSPSTAQDAAPRAG